MMIKRLEHEHEWLWFKQRTAVPLCEDMIGFIAVKDDGTIAAAAVGDHWGPSGVHTHLAIDDPMAFRHGLMETACEYAFIERGADCAFGFVPSNNIKAYLLDKKLGYSEVCRVPDYFGEGIDYIVMRMDRDNCRWLKKYKEAA